MNEGYAFMGMCAAARDVLCGRQGAQHLDSGPARLPARARVARSKERGCAPEDVTRQIDAELAARDATIARLEERVRVLERIATDAPARLGAEIERLRDEPIARRATG